MATLSVVNHTLIGVIDMQRKKIQIRIKIIIYCTLITIHKLQLAVSLIEGHNNYNYQKQRWLMYSTPDTRVFIKNLTQLLIEQEAIIREINNDERV